MACNGIIVQLLCSKQLPAKVEPNAATTPAERLPYYTLTAEWLEECKAKEFIK